MKHPVLVVSLAAVLSGLAGATVGHTQADGKLPVGNQVKLDIANASSIHGTLVERLPNAMVIRVPCLTPWCNGSEPKMDTVAINNVRAAFYRLKPPIGFGPLTGAIGGGVVGGAVGFARDTRFQSRLELVGAGVVVGALSGVATSYLLDAIWPKWKAAF